MKFDKALRLNNTTSITGFERINHVRGIWETSKKQRGHCIKHVRETGIDWLDTRQNICTTCDMVSLTGYFCHMYDSVPFRILGTDWFSVERNAFRSLFPITCPVSLHSETLFGIGPIGPYLYIVILNKMGFWRFMEPNLGLIYAYLTMLSIAYIIQHRMIGWIMNWKDVQGSGRGLIWDATPAYVRRDWENLWKPQDIRSPGQDLNLGFPKYEAAVSAMEVLIAGIAFCVLISSSKRFVGVGLDISVKFGLRK
jgi:hypothetical protein